MSIVLARFTPSQALKDIGERVGWTFAQNFVIVIVSTGSAGLYDHQAWAKSACVAGWAALASLVAALISALTQWHPTGYAALFDRAARTFLASFAGVMATSTLTSLSDAGVLSALGVGVSTAFLAAMKSLIGTANPDTVADTTVVDGPVRARTVRLGKRRT